MLLFFAFILRLFGANPQAGFAEWVYRSTARVMAPFRGLFEPVALSDESVLDTSLLFAMIVYGFIALLLRAGIDWITDRIDERRRQLEYESQVAFANAEAAQQSIPPALAGTPTPGGASQRPTPVVPARPPAGSDPDIPI